MDMQTPDHRPRPPSPAVSPRFIARLLKGLAATAPGGANADQAAREEDEAAARELFEALEPGDAAEAQLAAIAVASAQAAMDGFARAARPGLSDETVVRLRSNALAAGRAYAAAMRSLRRRTPAPARPAAAETAAPPAAPPREPEASRPRDRFGKPIPASSTDLKTRPQVFPMPAHPRNAELEAAAIAEEDAMITGQAETDRRNRSPG